MAIRHTNDVQYFWDAIEQFSFDYEFYTLSGVTKVDELGNRVLQYTKSTIRGSLQASGGYSKAKDKSGATTSATFKFYCESKYQFHIDDFIKTDGGEWLICTGVDEPYSEWGVRSGTFAMTDLSHHKELAAYVKYLNGEESV